MSSQETQVESCTDNGPDEERRTVLACPGCDSSDIRTKNGLQGCKAAADHVCRDCGNAFSDAESVRRQPKRSVTTPPPIARNLENANPEDVGGPMTDGGHEPDYECRHCDWAGDECDRREHYPVCPNCSRIVKVRQELVADGGVPETFDDLTGTCEHCGDDVDPERLVEGESPGCHYRPVADGGTTWTDLTGFKRDLLEAIRRLENTGNPNRTYDEVSHVQFYYCENGDDSNGDGGNGDNGNGDDNHHDNCWPNSTTLYIGFSWKLPFEVGDEIHPTRSGSTCSSTPGSVATTTIRPYAE